MKPRVRLNTDDRLMSDTTMTKETNFIELSDLTFADIEKPQHERDRVFVLSTNASILSTTPATRLARARCVGRLTGKKRRFLLVNLYCSAEAWCMPAPVHLKSL
jgi:hypothetical protein